MLTLFWVSVARHYWLLRINGVYL